MVYCFGYWCGDMHTLLSETVGENFILTFEQMNNDIIYICLLRKPQMIENDWKSRKGNCAELIISLAQCSEDFIFVLFYLLLLSLSIWSITIAK